VQNDHQGMLIKEKKIKNFRNGWTLILEIFVTLTFFVVFTPGIFTPCQGGGVPIVRLCVFARIAMILAEIFSYK